MKQKILFVVTSHGELGDTGRKTGYFLSEVTHPWSVLSEAFDIDVVSPKGGCPPVDGFDLKDPINNRLWNDPAWQMKMHNTLTPDKVDPTLYRAIFFAGGHGAMWDFPDNKELQRIASAIYTAGGYVAAVCHGPAGLVNIPLPDGSLLIDKRRFDCFTNEEERLNGTQDVVPFHLQTALEEHGGIFDGAPAWSDHVVEDGRLITGQNPMSALSLGELLLERLSGHQPQ